MSRKIKRRRPSDADDPGSTSLGDMLSKAQKKAAADATAAKEVVQRRGPVQAVRRTDQEERARTAPEPEAPRDKLDLSGLEELARMDRADLDALMGAQPLSRRLREGERIQARVTRVTGHSVLLDVGLKAEAVMDREEIPQAAPGDLVEAYVVFTDGEDTRLSKRLSGDSAAAFLDQAQASGVPVEGTVTGRNSGGFTVKVGSVSAFCPVSHIDRIAGGDLDAYVGRSLSFLVLETGDKTVLSRRRLQERDLAEDKERLLATIGEGMELEGTVSGVQPFGIFVDVTGVEGLVPRHEITTDRGLDLGTLFHRGQSLGVRVIGVDHAEGKVSFALRDPVAQPWDRVGVDYVEGGQYTGTVVGVEDYGLFVQLAPGITGLLHRSALVGEAPAEGDTVPVVLRSIDTEARRLALASPGAPGGRRPAAPSGPARTPDSGGFGTLADALKGWKQG